ncbi:rhodanese domain-containing protein CG4456 [Procambarus clarkii]|uniref:rhodanese domain-containing protein CG4456 n=1 Tax=Procambarus clarkii TaxID=6728 RepID=UPI0037436D42
MSDIDYEELSSDLDNYVVLDVRNRDEVKKTGRIPGSHCIPISELDDALDMDDDSFQEKYGFPKPTTDQTIVPHCQMGGRARRAGDALTAKGFQTRVYGGSFKDWTIKGGQVEACEPFEGSS